MMNFIAYDRVIALFPNMTLAKHTCLASLSTLEPPFPKHTYPVYSERGFRIPEFLLPAGAYQRLNRHRETIGRVDETLIFVLNNHLIDEGHTLEIKFPPLQLSDEQLKDQVHRKARLNDTSSFMPQMQTPSSISVPSK